MALSFCIRIADCFDSLFYIANSLWIDISESDKHDTMEATGPSPPCLFFVFPHSALHIYGISITFCCKEQSPLRETHVNKDRIFDSRHELIVIWRNVVQFGPPFTSIKCFIINCFFGPFSIKLVSLNDSQGETSVVSKQQRVHPGARDEHLLRQMVQAMAALGIRGHIGG
jgi:hypothetical protein